MRASRSLPTAMSKPTSVRSGGASALARAMHAARHHSAAGALARRCGRAILLGGALLPLCAWPALAQSALLPSASPGGGTAGSDTGSVAGDAAGGSAGITESGFGLPGTTSSFLLPATGVSVGSIVGGGYFGNVRSQVDQALGLAAPQAPGFTVIPGIGLQELVTDNVEETSRPRIADLVTTISPSIVIGANTQRIQGTLAYSPNIQLYAVTGQQDQVDHELNGSATVTLVPDLLFVDLRGYATQQATAGGFSPVGQPLYSQQDRTETTGFTFSPYVVQRLGDLLQVKAGYSLEYLNQSGDPAFGALDTGLLTPAQLAALQAAGQLPSFLGNNTLTHVEYATLSTTPELGRVSNTLQLRGEQDSGVGVLDGAYNYEAVDDVAYAVSHFVALLGRFGYQDLQYSGFPGVQVSQAVWGGGLRLTPNPDSAIVVRYGHQDGFDSAFLNASYALTARTRVFAGYSEGLSTDQQQIEDNLAGSDVDQFGDTLDSHTAAPLLLTDNLLGNQNNLYRLRRFSATSATSYDLDTISLNVLFEKESLVATGIGFTGYSDSGVSGSVSWTHLINETTSTLASVQYGTRNFSGLSTGVQAITGLSSAGTEQVFTLNASLSHAFSPTLEGSVHYTLNNRPSSTGEQGFLQNIALVGLRKTF